MYINRAREVGKLAELSRYFLSDFEHTGNMWSFQQAFDTMNEMIDASCKPRNAPPKGYKTEDENPLYTH